MPEGALWPPCICFSPLFLLPCVSPYFCLILSPRPFSSSDHNVGPEWVSICCSLFVYLRDSGLRSTVGVKRDRNMNLIQFLASESSLPSEIGARVAPACDGRGSVLGQRHHGEAPGRALGAGVRKTEDEGKVAWAKAKERSERQSREFG